MQSSLPPLHSAGEPAGSAFPAPDESFTRPSWGRTLWQRPVKQLGPQFLKAGGLLLIGGILLAGLAFVVLAVILSAAPQAGNAATPLMVAVILVGTLSILLGVTLLVVGFIWAKAG